MDHAHRLSKLTEREKDVLRRWQTRKTAKEIAIDLGVSHHAVEKRLKMARAKLDVASSLEAARLLSEAEGYQQTVAQPPDLATESVSAKSGWNIPLLTGAISMSAFAIAAAIILSQSSVAKLPLKPDDLLLVAPVPFAQLDKNGSGFLEGDETPPLIHAKGRASFTVNKNGERELQADQLIIDHSSLRQSFYRQADRNSDGRVSPQEFAQWAQPDRKLANKKMNADNAN